MAAPSQQQQLMMMCALGEARLGFREQHLCQQMTHVLGEAPLGVQQQLQLLLRLMQAWWEALQRWRLWPLLGLV